jgi:hypothetical protein
MAETGPSAFLALWNDIERGREAEYDAWHTREHVPERVAAPGFLGGRRYVDRGHPVHRYFTLYDVADLGAFRTPQYRDLLDNPTDWSAAMRPSFRNFLRVPCAQEHAAGFGLGAGLAVVRLALPSGTRPLREEVAAFAAAPGMVRARLGRRTEGLPTAAWRQAPAEPGAPDEFDAVLLLEALDRSAAQQAFDEACQRFWAGAAPTDVGGVYDLAFVFPGLDPGEREAHRRASWAAMPATAPA